MHLQQLVNRLTLQANVLMNLHQQQFARLLVTLHAVSPLATLDRGYALATCNNKVIIDSQQVNIGDIIDIRLAKGQLKSKVLCLIK